MIIEGICNIFKFGLLQSDNAYKIALYGPDSEISQETMSYFDAKGEVEGEGYVKGGVVLTGKRIALYENEDGSKYAAMWWDDPKWEKSTITARGALIYDDSRLDKPSVCVVDFGEDVISLNGLFVVEIPKGEESIIAVE